VASIAEQDFSSPEYRATIQLNIPNQPSNLFAPEEYQNVINVILFTTGRVSYYLKYHSEYLGFWFSSAFEKLDNTTFWKLDLFSSSGEEGGDTYTVESLERANIE
jgi:hypothetical protein